MPSTFLFLSATLLLSLNLVRPFGLAISDWLYFGALGFAFVETFSVERWHISSWWRNPLLWAIAPILFGAVISTMNSQNWPVALAEIVQQAFVISLFVSLAWIMVCRGRIAPVILALIASGVFTAGIVLLDSWTGSRLGPILSGTPDVQFWGRYGGTLGHPNKLGYFLVLTTLLSIGELFSLRPSRTLLLRRLIWGALIAVQLFGIYSSGSVTAYLGLLLGVVVLTLSSKPIFTGVTRTLGIAIGAAMLVIVLMTLFNSALMGSTSGFESNVIAQAVARVQTITAESRLEGYTHAWNQITHNPWFGVGYDQISTSGISGSARLLESSVHNSLLQVWYTGGLFAFVGWLAIYVLVGWMALRVILQSRRNALSPLILSLAAAALAILLMDQFQDAIYQREKWLVIGLLVGVALELVRQERAANMDMEAVR